MDYCKSFLTWDDVVNLRCFTGTHLGLHISVKSNNPDMENLQMEGDTNSSPVIMVISTVIDHKTIQQIGIGSP